MCKHCSKGSQISDCFIIRRDVTNKQAQQPKGNISISVEQVEECSVHPISSRDESDSQSSTEEVSQLFTSTSRGAFPQK